MDLNERYLRLKNDFEFYARNCLFIRAKDGQIRPFELNKAQKYIHALLEDQKARTGKVRAIILKGRQQGCSTLIGARFYHLSTWSKGVRTYILTHEDNATQNLFDMVNRYHDNCPPFVRPKTGAANAKELSFSELDSGYKVGTAGTKGTGRSSTIQLFHGSEVAFWPNAQSHASGVLQAVPDADGTEVILESTAKGVGNYFHQQWQDAERGDGDFIAIFVPWYWQDEYSKTPPENFSLTDEEMAYKATYGLTDGQMYWRRNKIIELKSEVAFKEEYPATASEAFQMSGHDGFIKPEMIVKARKTQKEPVGGLIIGVDPARFGDDRTAIARRIGPKVVSVERREKLDTMQVAGWVKSIIDGESPDRVFIDVGGLGAGVYDRLVEMGYGEVVRAVNFGGSPFEPAKLDDSGRVMGGQPKNRRAEMWMKSRDWLLSEAGVDIPDEDWLQADACAPGYKYDSNQMLIIESKDDMKRRGVKSPDGWDSVALTFAEPVAPARKFSFDLNNFTSEFA